MADEELRFLERAWQETGTVEAGQAYLRELVRTGARQGARYALREAVLRKQLSDSDLTLEGLARFDAIPDDLCFRFTVHGSQAVALWGKLRKLVDATGYWPLMLGEEGGRWSVADQVEMSAGVSVAEVLEAAANDDNGRAIRREKIERELEGYRSMNLSREVSEEVEVIFQRKLDGTRPPLPDHVSLGEWPDDPQPAESFTIPYDLLSREPHAALPMALLPTTEGAQAPAWLRFGGWNECPRAEDHVLKLRSWKERFDAEPIGFTGDIIELYVNHPPTTREVAMELAVEQYHYCSDIVEQGVGTVNNLASILMDGFAWYFWWD